jgi:hypothetical protein
LFTSEVVRLSSNIFGENENSISPPRSTRQPLISSFQWKKAFLGIIRISANRMTTPLIKQNVCPCVNNFDLKLEMGLLGTEKLVENGKFGKS